MQNRCREKKKVGGEKGEMINGTWNFDRFCSIEKKASETKETKLNGTIDENGEQSDASIMSADGHNSSGVVKEEITPKRNAQRTAKGKVAKYGEDDDEDDED